MPEHPTWRAQYRTSDGKLSWDVDLETRECPVSIISEESKLAVRQFSEARLTNKLGGVLYGHDSSRWPARWHDIVTLLQAELDTEDGAFQRAKAQYFSRQH